MGPKTTDDPGRLGFVILVVCIVSGVLASYLMLKIDSIIHGQLYDYGLQFSTDWADPYWTAARMMFGFLALPVIVSAMVLGLKLIRSRRDTAGNFPKSKEKPFREKQPAALGQSELQIGAIFQEDDLLAASFSSESEHLKEVKKRPVQPGNGLLISCPNCSRVFNRPLVMLDFSSGSTRLVNICPYCNHNLGETLEQRKSSANIG